MKKATLLVGLALLFSAITYAQEKAKKESAYEKQVKIYEALNNVTIDSESHCKEENLLVTSNGKLLVQNGKALVTKQSKCLYEIYGLEIASVHPDSLSKNLNFVELSISYSIKTSSNLPDTLTVSFILPNKERNYSEELIIDNSPMSGITTLNAKLKDFVNGHYIILFESKNGENHNYSFELSDI